MRKPDTDYRSGLDRLQIRLMAAFGADEGAPKGTRKLDCTETARAFCGKDTELFDVAAQWLQRWFNEEQEAKQKRYAEALAQHRADWDKLDKWTADNPLPAGTQRDVPQELVPSAAPPLVRPAQMGWNDLQLFMARRPAPLPEWQIDVLDGRDGIYIRQLRRVKGLHDEGCSKRAAAKIVAGEYAGLGYSESSLAKPEELKPWRTVLDE
jgi:hypothetical protein